MDIDGLMEIYKRADLEDTEEDWGKWENAISEFFAPPYMCGEDDEWHEVKDRLLAVMGEFIGVKIENDSAMGDAMGYALLQMRMNEERRQGGFQDEEVH